LVSEDTKTSVPVDQVIRANVAFYREVARKYDSYETCSFDPLFQRMLEADMEQIASFLSQVEGRPVRCLDCGGGTGNLSIKLLQRGWDVTVVDVSREMLDILEEKCRALELKPTIRAGSLEEFLETTDADYDLVSFGSVLHHLHSYQRVIQLAAQRLRPGGIFYSNFDPVPPEHTMAARLCGSVDILFAKLFFDHSSSNWLLPSSGNDVKLPIVLRHEDWGWP